MRYLPAYATGREWVVIGPGIDSQREIWAHDLGAAENSQLMHYYPGRDAVLLELTSADPTGRLVPYTDAGSTALKPTLAPLGAAGLQRQGPLPALPQ